MEVVRGRIDPKRIGGIVAFSRPCFGDVAVANGEVGRAEIALHSIEATHDAIRDAEIDDGSGGIALEGGDDGVRDAGDGAVIDGNASGIAWGCFCSDGDGRINDEAVANIGLTTENA